MISEAQRPLRWQQNLSLVRTTTISPSQICKEVEKSCCRQGPDDYLFWMNAQSIFFSAAQSKKNIVWGGRRVSCVPGDKKSSKQIICDSTYIHTSIHPLHNLCGRRKKGRGRGKEKSVKEGKREGSACYKIRCFYIPPTYFLTYPIPINCQYVTNLKQGASQHGSNYFVYRTLFSSDIIIESNKTSLLLLLPQQTRQIQTTSTLSFFHCSQSTTNYDQFRVNTQDLWPYLIKHRIVTKNRAVAGLRRE